MAAQMADETAQERVESWALSKADYMAVLMADWMVF